MEALHRTGGVPPGWEFGVPPGDSGLGRHLYIEFGCNSCHRIEGDPEASPEGDATGPDLSGMGSHHPPGYFAEAILNPDAVLVEGPGYLGRDGRSIMPVYPDMTLSQLANIVAYLRSLTQPAGPHAHHAAAAQLSPAPPVAGLPPASESDDSVFLVQSYRLKEGSLDAFQTWFESEGAAAFLAADGMLSVETYVDRTRGVDVLTSVFRFRDLNALNAFANDPTSQELGLKFDSFVGRHGHLVFSDPPLYRVDRLSTPAE